MKAKTTQRQAYREIQKCQQQQQQDDRLTESDNNSIREGVDKVLKVKTTQRQAYRVTKLTTTVGGKA